MLECVLVMDFGGQYCHLIARRIRELGVYSEIIPPAADLGDYGDRYEIKGFILSGGPQSVYEKDSQRLREEFMKHIRDENIPVLGICYGHQVIAFYEGGEIESGGMKEYGVTDMVVDKSVSILKGLSRKEKVWMSHSDTVTGMPPGYEILAHTRNSPVVAFRHRKKQIYGVQFHPEVVHTEKGVQVFRNYLFNICKCKGNWEMGDFIEESIEKINTAIGEKKAVIALSGGVDSSTAAVLAHRAIGKQLTSVFIDTGLMRKNEPESIQKTFTEDFHLNFRFVDAKERFFKVLEGVSDPEEKRKIIGETFIKVFEDVAREVGADYLIQGTIYPDRIESGLKDAATIKTHHNVGGLPEVLGIEIVEPLQDLYKDEVREVARKLGLPEEISERHPFPGPGLAIRVIGEVTRESVAIVKEADAIVKEEIKSAGLEKGLWQFFAVLLSIKTVGVQGDVRTYRNTVALRIVESVDGMTANFAEIPYVVLERISTRITNEIPEVNRVVYDLTHKPPGTIEWE